MYVMTKTTPKFDTLQAFYDQKIMTSKFKYNLIYSFGKWASKLARYIVLEFKNDNDKIVKCKLNFTNSHNLYFSVDDNEPILIFDYYDFLVRKNNLNNILKAKITFC
jgi:hypothetical protein